MRSVCSTLLFLVAAYSVHAQIAGEAPRAEDDVATPKPPDEETIRYIKQLPLHTQFEFYYLQSISQGELRSAFELMGAPAVGYGFGAEYSYYLDPVPLSFGGDLSVLFNGADSKSLWAGSAKYNVRSSNTQVPVLFHARFQPNIDSWFFPYAEAVGGFTFYSSSVSIERIYFGDTTESSNGDGSAMWNYGIGAGLAIKVADVITLPNSLQRTLFDVRIRYLWGTSATIPNAELDGGNTLGYNIIGVEVDKPHAVSFRAGFIFQL